MPLYSSPGRRKNNRTHTQQKRPHLLSIMERVQMFRHLHVSRHPRHQSSQRVGAGYGLRVELSARRDKHATNDAVICSVCAVIIMIMIIDYQHQRSGMCTPTAPRADVPASARQPSPPHQSSQRVGAGNGLRGELSAAPRSHIGSGPVRRT